MSFKPVKYHGVVFKNYCVNKNGDIYNIKTSRQLKASVCGTCPYPVIQIFDPEGNRKKLLVHRIVAESFVPLTINKNSGIMSKEWRRTPASVKRYLMKNMIVNHIDHDKTNCRSSNLEWVTQEENATARNKFYGI
jgi:hypothetical protein